MPAPSHGPVAVFEDCVPDRLDRFSCNPFLNCVVIYEHHKEAIRFGTGYVGGRVFGGVVDRVGTHASDAQPVKDLSDIAAGGGAGNDARWIDLRTPIRHA